MEGNVAKKKKRARPAPEKKRRAAKPKPKSKAPKKRVPKVGPKPGRTYPEKRIMQDPKTGKFLPGNCANPYGRPEGALSVTDAWIRALRRKIKRDKLGRIALDKIMETLVDQAIGAALKDQLSVVKEAADRLEGKPAQTVLTPNLGKGVMDGLDEDELLKIIACEDVVEDDEGEKGDT